MTLIVRAATPDDAPAMTGLLNQIIGIGGSTAHQRPFDTDRMLHHYIVPNNSVCCSVAKVAGQIAGFQSLVWATDAADPMPDGWAIIATFVDPTRHGQRIGQHLFGATRTAAVKAGVQVIDATIRADNAAGLRYYSGLGFTNYDRLVAVPLRDGTPVDRIRKRFDLP